DKYRLPIVLCELRELTTAQAAAELAWPVGTVASRLSRGRQLLARRLRRLGLPSGAFPPAAAPTRLGTETVSAAVARGSGSPAAPPALFHEVIRAMSVSKIRLACAGLIACVAITATAVGFLPGTFAAPRKGESNHPAPAQDPIDRVKLRDLSALLQVEAV